ncbi:MAG TPA: peptide chain release factor-like protein [Chloroflexaceae bacterium]|nr:peptide chain release factor-like protein [Chloroflexaceae bacterium]
MDEQAESVDELGREALERESEATFFIASGPGGQHRNRNATGVRLLHRPSGIVVTATERRSQAANLEVAYARLARRLAAARAVTAPRVATRPTRAAREERRGVKRRRGALKALRGPVRGEE